MTKPSSVHSSPPIGNGVVLDIGTGDGSFVYRSARRDPSRFYIGLDAEPRGLRETSTKAFRKPAKGGVPNALFLRAAAESLPRELDHVADEVHVHFPWGSLLRAVLAGDEAILRNLRRACAPGAWLEIVWSIDPERDAAELARLSLPANLTGDPTNDRTRASVHPFSTTYLLPADAEAYATVGFSIKEHGTLDSPKWPHLNTTWARRLQGHRRLSYLIAQAT